jgi:branched-chain amino acid transport system ATP-binding protein
MRHWEWIDVSILQCRSLAVSYGGVAALTAADLRVESGRLVGLIGPNGAGKTTLIDAVSGFARSSGEVLFDGFRLDGRSPHRRIRAGIGRTFQNLELFDDLTVLENLLIAAEPVRWWSPLLDIFGPMRRSGRAESAMSALRAVGAERYADVLPGELPNGTRKLVAVGRALAADPSVILLDEPAAGLDTEESALLGRRLRSLVDGGLGILLVDHDMGLVLSVCDYVYVLDFGVVIARGTPPEILANDAVIKAYLGSGAHS